MCWFGEFDERRFHLLGNHCTGAGNLRALIVVAVVVAVIVERVLLDEVVQRR